MRRTMGPCSHSPEQPVRTSFTGTPAAPCAASSRSMALATSSAPLAMQLVPQHTRIFSVPLGIAHLRFVGAFGILRAVALDDAGDAADKSKGKFESLTGVLKGVGVALAAVATAAAAAAVKLGKEVTMRRFVNSRHGFTVRLVDEWVEAQQLILDVINMTPALPAKEA